MILAVKEAGLSETIYYAFFCVGFLATYVFLIWYGKKIGIKLLKLIVAVIVGSISVLCAMAIMREMLIPLESKLPIMNSYLNNMGRGFLFVPVIALVVSLILKESWARICNIYSFTQTIIWGFASLGCLFAGCCRGYPWEWGIYNAMTETRLFPTQIINSILLLSVAVYIYIRNKKMRYEPDGKEYPIVLIFVGIIRFSTEFLMDNAKIVFGLSSLSFDSIAMCIVGIIMFICIDRKQKSR